MQSESQQPTGANVVVPGPTPSTTTDAAKSAEFNAGPYGWTVGISLFLLLIALIALLRLASLSLRHIDSYLVILVGALLGWAAGMYSSPYSSIEKTNFVSISQAVSAFVSGYLLSKLDRFLEVSLFSANGIVGSAWTLVGFFTIAFLIFAIGTYTCRRYFAAKEHEEPVGISAPANAGAADPSTNAR